MKDTPPTPSRNKRLDREQLLEAARHICDNEGLESLTLRRLGAELGVDATALYRHFRDKAALLTAMIDDMFASIPRPSPTGTWQENLRGIMHQWWSLYRNNPTLAHAMAGQSDDQPNLMKFTEYCLHELSRAGVPQDLLGTAYQTVYNHVVGHGLVAAFSFWITDTETRDQQRRFFAALDPELFPTVSSAAHTLYPDPDSIFHSATELLLDSITHW